MLDELINPLKHLLLIVLFVLIIEMIRLINHIALSIFMIVVAVLSFKKSKKLNDQHAKKTAILSLISSIGQVVFSIMWLPLMILLGEENFDFWNAIFTIISYILIVISLFLTVSDYNLILKKPDVLPQQD